MFACLGGLVVIPGPPTTASHWQSNMDCIAAVARGVFVCFQSDIVSCALSQFSPHLTAQMLIKNNSFIEHKLHQKKNRQNLDLKDNFVSRHFDLALTCLKGKGLRTSSLEKLETFTSKQSGRSCIFVIFQNDPSSFFVVPCFTMMI